MRFSDRQIRVIGTLMLAAGLAVCAVSIFSEQLGLGAEEARGTFGWKRASLLVAGAVTAAIGVALSLRPQLISKPENQRRIERLLRYPTDVQLRYLAIGLLALLGLTLLWTRLLKIDSSLWHDEAHTVLNYSGVGLGPILFGEGAYSINNHVLYNLLSWATTGLLGESEAMYRLWSVVPAIAAIAAGTWWAWRRLGPVIAVTFAALAVAAPQHLELAPQARGYGLALLAGTLMLIGADHLARAYGGRAFLGFVGAGLLGIWTLHAFAIAFVGQALALLRWPNLRRPVIAGVALAGVLSAVFYAPVLTETLAESRPRGETISLGSALILEHTIAWLVAPSFTEPLGVEQARWMGLPVLALVALAIVALWRRRDLGLALILVVPPLFFNLFIAVTGLSAVPRHQLFLLTHVLVLVAIGIAELGRIIARYWPLRPLAVAAGVVAVLALANAAVDSEQREALPPENFKGVAEFVEWAGVGPVVTDSMRPDGLRYYLGDDLVEMQPDEVEALLCAPHAELVYIRHAPFSPSSTLAEEGFTSPASLECVTGEDAVRVRVPQRHRGGAIDVWIINPRVRPEVIEDDLEYAPGF
jgi:hypothetical protein